MTGYDYLDAPFDVICRDALLGVPMAFARFEEILMMRSKRSLNRILYEMDMEIRLFTMSGKETPSTVIYAIIRIVFDPALASVRSLALLCIMNTRSRVALDAFRAVLELPQNGIYLDDLRGFIRQLELASGGGQ